MSNTFEIVLLIALACISIGLSSIRYEIRRLGKILEDFPAKLAKLPPPVVNIYENDLQRDYDIAKVNNQLDVEREKMRRNGLLK